MKYVVANWKMHHTIESARNFFATSREALRLAKDIEIVICPSFPLLPIVRDEIIGTPMKLGAQNLSAWEEGAYTGEVSAVQLTGLADYVIIGHSERRKYFHESDQDISSKLSLALKHGSTPILCFEQVGQVDVAQGLSKIVLAYEPAFAIGTGQPDTPDNAAKVAAEVKSKVGDLPVLYGGSVDKINAKDYLNEKEIAGALVGRASLDPIEFVSLVHSVSS